MRCLATLTLVVPIFTQALLIKVPPRNNLCDLLQEVRGVMASHRALLADISHHFFDTKRRLDQISRNIDRLDPATASSTQPPPPRQPPKLSRVINDLQELRSRSTLVNKSGLTIPPAAIHHPTPSRPPRRKITETVSELKALSGEINRQRDRNVFTTTRPHPPPSRRTSLLVGSSNPPRPKVGVSGEGVMSTTTLPPPPRPPVRNPRPQLSNVVGELNTLANRIRNSITTSNRRRKLRRSRNIQEHRYPPCEPPFEEIAYHMCILQEIQLRLSWNDAWNYCWARGAELAQDGVVIKTRRFFNNLYGEEGTRVRWPVWIGGLQEEGVWRWRGGRRSEVLPFFWAQEEPRQYSSDLTPEGTCMIMDGYKRFHAASLPCHLKRRFVCQRRD